MAAGHLCVGAANVVPELLAIISADALDAVELAALPTTLADLRFSRNIQDY